VNGKPVSTPLTDLKKKTFSSLNFSLLDNNIPRYESVLRNEQLKIIDGLPQFIKIWVLDFMVGLYGTVYGPGP